MRKNILLFSIFLLCFTRVASAIPPITIPPPTGSNYLITSYSIFEDWLPVVMLAILLTVGIAGIYYLIGVLINNNKVKASALAEFGQAFGSAALVVIVIIILNFFGNVLQIADISPGNGHASYQSTIQTICSQLSGSYIDFLNSYGEFSPGKPTPSNLVCSGLIGTSGLGSTPLGLTQNIDFGLGSTYVIMDNLTNQTVRNMNQLYMYDGILVWVRSFKNFEAICVPAECWEPLTPYFVEIKIDYDYFLGYVLHRGVTPVMATQNGLMFYLFFTQLLFIIIMLVSWPYLLAAGMILRTLMFTRRAGGFLIAITLSALIFYPFLTAFEYSSLNNINNLQPLGAETLPNLALCGRDVNVAWTGPWDYSNLPYLSRPNMSYLGLNGVYCYTDVDLLPATYIFKIPAVKVDTGFSTIHYLPYWQKTENYLVACYLPTSINKDCFLACPPGYVLPQNSPPGTQQCYVKRHLNLYVLPSPADVANLYSYWPGDSILPAEVQMSIWGINPAETGRIFTIANAFFFSFLGNNFGGASIPQFPISIGPTAVANTMLTFVHLFAFTSVIGFILPLLNVLILVSATLGLSSLLGGEVTILGLGRFI